MALWRWGSLAERVVEGPRRAAFTLHHGCTCAVFRTDNGGLRFNRGALAEFEWLHLLVDGGHRVRCSNRSRGTQITYLSPLEFQVASTQAAEAA